MLFNLAQKFASVLATFLTILLIIHFLDLAFLGLYAFLTASGTVFAAITPLGLRSVYLREIVRDRGDLDAQRTMTIITEVVPKVLATVLFALLMLVAKWFELDTIDALCIAAIGTFLASTQLTSQKVRSHDYNTLSQTIINARPMVFMAGVAILGALSTELLEAHFRWLIVAAFAVPAILAYGFWLARFHHLIFGHVAPGAIAARAKELAPEMPGLFLLEFGQKAMARFDVILITAFLSLDAAGVYRVCTQIVTVANASMVPLSSRFMKQYSRLLGEDKLDEAAIVERKIALSAVALYLLTLGVGVLMIYFGPFLENIRYRQDFMLGLGILAFSGLLKASIPMVENYVVYRRNSNKGGLILLGLVIATSLAHIAAIKVFGLPGACAVTVVSVLAWRIIVRRFL